MEWLGRIQDLLKLEAKHYAALVLISGVLLFVPDGLLGAIRLQEVREKYGLIVGAVFLVASGLLLVNGFAALFARIGRSRRARRRREAVEQRVRALDPKAQAVLREFYIRGQKTLEGCRSTIP